MVGVLVLSLNLKMIGMLPLMRILIKLLIGLIVSKIIQIIIQDEMIIDLNSGVDVVVVVVVVVDAVDAVDVVVIEVSAVVKETDLHHAIISNLNSEKITIIEVVDHLYME